MAFPGKAHLFTNRSTLMPSPTGGGSPRPQQGHVIPNWLLRRPEISPGAKLAYGRIARSAVLKQPLAIHDLAADIGVIYSSAARYVTELTTSELIGRYTSDKQNFFVLTENAWQLAASRALAHTPAPARPRDEIPYSDTTYPRTLPGSPGYAVVGSVSYETSPPPLVSTGQVRNLSGRPSEHGEEADTQANTPNPTPGDPGDLRDPGNVRDHANDTDLPGRSLGDHADSREGSGPPPIATGSPTTAKTGVVNQNHNGVSEHVEARQSVLGAQVVQVDAVDSAVGVLASGTRVNAPQSHQDAFSAFDKLFRRWSEHHQAPTPLAIQRLLRNMARSSEDVPWLLEAMDQAYKLTSAKPYTFVGLDSMVNQIRASGLTPDEWYQAGILRYQREHSLQARDIGKIAKKPISFDAYAQRKAAGK